MDRHETRVSWNFVSRDRNLRGKFRFNSENWDQFRRDRGRGKLILGTRVPERKMPKTESPLPYRSFGILKFYFSKKTVRFDLIKIELKCPITSFLGYFWFKNQRSKNFGVRIDRNCYRSNKVIPWKSYRSSQHSYRQPTLNHIFGQSFSFTLLRIRSDT